ncbi:MAG: class I SAM-dependent methyltransferase [Nitrosomonas sp.]|nr:class I SAM-dependent methyltransferase [Nitrosomonas sp.]
MTTTNDLEVYRASEREQMRTADLFRLMPARGVGLALDVGARDGHFSRLMTQRFDKVVALDLVKPDFQIQGVDCVAGDATALAFPDAHFDFVLCAEVLEHIPPQKLATACRELARVCRGQLLIGVPDRQDLRVSRTTCQVCGRSNPPWGHVNSFDDRRLRVLFEGCAVREVSRVGVTNETTNALSAWLMDLAGNPYGTYGQEEPCVHCGAALGRPAPRALPQKLLTKLAFWIRSATAPLTKPRANWVHVLFSKSPDI